MERLGVASSVRGAPPPLPLPRVPPPSPPAPPPPPCGLAPGWVASWSKETKRFTFRHEMTGGVSLEMPPKVPAGWEVSWSTDYDCFQFLKRRISVSA